VGELNEASLKEMLDEARGWQLLARGDLATLSRRVVERALFVASPSQGEGALKFLRKYVSAKNYSTASTTVTDPIVAGEPYDGVWALDGLRLEYLENRQNGGALQLAVVERLKLVVVLDQATSALRAAALAGLGYSVKGALEAAPWDRIDRLVEVEGVALASRTMVETDSSSGIAASDLIGVTAFAMSGYAVLGREFVPDENNATGTVRIGFLKTQTFAADVETVTKRGASGTRDYAQERRVEGLSWTQATADLAAATAGSGFALAARAVREMGAGRWALETDEGAAYTGTGDADALVIRWKANKSGGRALLRVWFRRTATAKATLVGATKVEEVWVKGNAQSDYSYTWPGDEAATTFKHLESWIEPESGNTYTVWQQLAENVEVGGVVPFGSGYDVSFPTKRVYTRTSDDLTKTIQYQKFVAQFTTEADAWEWIEDFGDSPPEGWTGYHIVDDTSKVAKHGEYQFVATFVALHPTDVGEWV
jgi:hypothetical protein